MGKLAQQQWFHRLCGHTIVNRPMTREDGPISVTVGHFGAIVPIYIDVCSCGAVW